MGSEVMRGGEFAEKHHCVDLAQLVGVLAHGRLPTSLN
jgi:hypothetical protein